MKNILILIMSLIISLITFDIPGGLDSPSSKPDNPYGETEVSSSYALIKFGNPELDNTSFIYKFIETFHEQQKEEHPFEGWVTEHPYYGHMQFIGMKMGTTLDGLSFYLQKGGYDYPIQMVPGKDIEEGSSATGKTAFGEPRYLIKSETYSIDRIW